MFNLFKIVLSSQISSAIPHHHIASYRLIPYDIIPHHIVPYHTIKHNIIIICKKTLPQSSSIEYGVPPKPKNMLRHLHDDIFRIKWFRKMHSYLGAVFFKVFVHTAYILFKTNQRLESKKSEALTWRAPLLVTNQVKPKENTLPKSSPLKKRAKTPKGNNFSIPTTSIFRWWTLSFREGANYQPKQCTM